MNNTKPRLLLMRGRGPVSLGIRWVTRGVYTHAALLGPDEADTIYESWQGHGVRKAIITDWTDVDVFEVPEMSEEGWRKCFAWFETQLGKPYDYHAIAGFVTKRQQPPNGKWICSEIVFEAILKGGVPLLRGLAYLFSPNHLSYSPLIRQDFTPR